MDIRLPGQNGYVTTKKIREMDSEVPIIAQTAYALEGDNQRALEAGCNDYIAKPIRPSLLLEKVKGLF
jgi:CheY-like chemotaxis protein